MKQCFNVIVVGGPFQDIPLATNHAKVYAESVVKHGVSMVFDFTETEDEQLVGFAAEFLARLFTLENVVRRPILLFFEELSEYCPFSSKGKLVPPWIYERMASRIVKIATQGRSLGINMVATSQRPAQLNFTVRMMMNLSLYGKFHPKDLNDIKEVLSSYKLQTSVRETAQKCIDMPHGHWLAITSAQATYTKIDVKRVSPHGADTPKIEYVAPMTSEVQETVNNLAETIKSVLQKEKEEETEIVKLKKRIIELNQKLVEKEEENRQLSIALKVKGSEAPEKIVEKVGIDPEALRTFMKRLRDGLIETFDRETDSFLGIKELTFKRTEVNENVVDMWLQKLPTPMSKKVFKFLVDHKGMKFTKSQLGLQTGYSSSSGSFNSTLSLLKRNNLVKTDGESFWVE